jgi:hypothetical protein
MTAQTSLGAQWSPISASEDQSIGAPDSSQLASPKHYLKMAKKGRAKLAKMASVGHPGQGMEQNYSSVKEHAWNAVQEPWGGSTYWANSGTPVNRKSGYSVTVREPGQEQLGVHIGASREHFNNAMDQAKDTYRLQLGRSRGSLGVFRNEKTGNIDIDPVAITDRPVDAREIGAYTHAAGGAYDFSTGNGVWPPHVAKKQA